MSQGAAFYDLDKTIIAKSSTLAFRRPFAMAGLIGPVDSLTAGAAQSFYRLVGASGGQLDDAKARLSDMISGWPVDKVEALVAGTVEQIIAPYVYVEALQTIREHKAAGRIVVVISSSPREWVEPIGYMVGADRVIATQLAVSGGKYTGEILFYAYGEQKAVALQALAEAEGLDLSDSYAYSDSFTDLPMLEAVGHPVAVNPDSELRDHAEAQGWPVRHFVRPPSWDSPLSYVWDAVSALPDVGAAASIGVRGTVTLASGAVVAARDALLAVLNVAVGSEDEQPFFPTVRGRRVRGLQPVTVATVRDAFTGEAGADPADLVRRAADLEAATRGSVIAAVESIGATITGASDAAVEGITTALGGAQPSKRVDTGPAHDPADDPGDGPAPVGGGEGTEGAEDRGGTVGT